MSRSPVCSPRTALARTSESDVRELFGLLEAGRRQWRWALAYGVLGLGALITYQRFGQFSGGGGQVFFSNLGSSPDSVA